MLDDPHADTVRKAFAQQAAAFEDPRLNRLFTTDSEWLFERLPLAAEDLVLDVAAGTGHVARRLAPRVCAVVAVDATAAMLEQGREHAPGNVIAMRGDAAALPFLDGSLDVVVSRFAVHHFERPEVEVAEMRRCIRPGGRLAIADLVAEHEANRLERLRDPSHTRMLTRGARRRARGRPRHRVPPVAQRRGRAALRPHHGVAHRLRKASTRRRNSSLA